MKDVLKVEIENIQAVKHASIEIEGFTAVVGRSNSGKSSIIRGMHAALTNKSPKTIFRTGTKQSRVKIEDEAKGISVEWKKGEKINAYHIDGKEFTKVGKEVPKEIEDHGFKEVRVNDEALEVQFARQHEYIFLLNRSGGFVADFISKITKADVLTGAVKDCESDIRKCSDNIKSSTKEKETLDEQLQRFVGLNKLETDLQETLSEIERSVALTKEVEFIESSCSERDASKGLIESLRGMPEIPVAEFDVDSIARIDAQIEERNALKAELSSLSNLPVIPECSFDIATLHSMESWAKERDSQKGRYATLKSIESLTVPEADFPVNDLLLIDQVYQAKKSALPELPSVPEISGLSEKIGAVLSLNDFSFEYETIEKDLFSVRDEIAENEKQLQSYEILKTEMQSQLGGCPTCGRSFDGKQEENCHSDSR